MKVLFIGGMKSGKSLHAEKYTQKLSKTKPLYLATTEFVDDEMQERIAKHKEQRAQKFVTVEEAVALTQELNKHQKGAVLIECLSIWVNNMLYREKSLEDMREEINRLMMQEHDIVFVINEVGCGIVPNNALARKFIDANGAIAQMVAQMCDEVYHVVAGISTKIK